MDSKRMTDFFGPVIFSYSRAEAIADGVLVDLTRFDVCKEHYREHVACTSTLWSLVEEAVSNPSFGNDREGVLHDILWMSRVGRRNPDAEQWIFPVIIRGPSAEPINLKMCFGFGDDGEPVWTLMLPNED